MSIVRTNVDDIPVLLVRPDDGPADGELALWLSHLGGSAEKELPTLQRLAATGRPVVSFDAPLHGRRAVDTDARAFATDVLAAFRRRMWPILGRATLDALRVISWAQHETGQDGRPVRAGGVSMGGDIAIAVAGIDDRVRRAVGVGSTPNWQRPDMRRLDDPDRLVDQGVADRYAQWFADELDPQRHLDRYLRPAVELSFELGTADHHIPIENAQYFATSLAELDEAVRVRITGYPGLDHFGVTTDAAALTAAIGWLVE